MPADIVSNRKALREYHILSRVEAGLELRGTEVKSVRAGKANLNDAYARVEPDGNAVLHNADIQPYEKASHEQHEPRRPRRLLLHRAEIDKLRGQTAVQGHALVALRMYWKNGRVKIELGLGKGKHAADKRADLKERITRRETEREVSRFNRRNG